MTLRDPLARVIHPETDRGTGQGVIQGLDQEVGRLQGPEETILHNAHKRKEVFTNTTKIITIAKAMLMEIVWEPTSIRLKEVQVPDQRIVQRGGQVCQGEICHLIMVMHIPNHQGKNQAILYLVHLPQDEDQRLREDTQ